MKVKISERALVARLRRAMAKDGCDLRKCRADTRGYNDFGDWYVVSTYNNAVDQTHCDLKKLAEEYEVLKGFEELEG